MDKNFGFGDGEPYTPSEDDNGFFDDEDFGDFGDFEEEPMEVGAFEQGHYDGFTLGVVMATDAILQHYGSMLPPPVREQIEAANDLALSARDTFDHSIDLESLLDPIVTGLLPRIAR